MSGTWAVITQTSATRIFGLLIGLVTLSLTARWLGPEGRGELAAIITWVGMFAMLGHLSLGQVAIREAAQGKNKAWVGEAIGALLFWTLVAVFFMGGSAWVLFELSAGKIFGNLSGELLLLGFIALPFLIWEKHGASLLTGLERLDIYNRYQIIGKSIGLVALVVFIMAMGLGVEGAVLAVFVGQGVLACGGLVFLFRLAGRPNFFNFPLNLNYLKSGLTLHLNAVGAYLYTASDILMLNYYRGAVETGYYQLGVQLMSVMLVIPQAASMAFYGKVSSMGPDKAWNVQRRFLVQILVLMSFGAIAAGLTAPWWLVWLAGESFSPTIDLFRWQLLSVIGMTFTVFMAAQWIGRGYFWQASLLTLLVGLCNIGANSILIPKHGMYGAIWASLGVYVIAIFGNGYMVWHCEKLRKQGRRGSA